MSGVGKRRDFLSFDAYPLLNALCSPVIILYDYFLTLKDEVELIWSRRMSYASAAILVISRATSIWYIFVVTLTSANVVSQHDTRS